MGSGKKAPHRESIGVGLRSPSNHRTGKVLVIGEALQQSVVGGSHVDKDLSTVMRQSGHSSSLATAGI